MPKTAQPSARSGRAKAGRLLLAVLLAGALSCSWMTEFVIVNASPEIIGVSYTFKRSTPDACCASLPEPAVAKASELDSSPVWREARSEETGDPGRVALRLAPGDALRVADLMSYSRPDLESWKEFPIQEIEIRNARGALRLCGPSILLAFESANRHRQELEFLGHPRQLHSGICEKPPSPPAPAPKGR